jgi:hypothetical protein
MAPVSALTTGNRFPHSPHSIISPTSLRADGAAPGVALPLAGVYSSDSSPSGASSRSSESTDTARRRFGGRMGASSSTGASGASSLRAYGFVLGASTPRPWCQLEEDVEKAAGGKVW